VASFRRVVGLRAGEDEGSMNTGERSRQCVLFMDDFTDFR
jgi:hypothetical protein